MMILDPRPGDDLGPRAERLSIPDRLLSVSKAAHRAAFHIDRRLIASPSRRHRSRSPLSRTDTAQRSRPATAAASLADSLQIDGKAPKLGVVTGDIVSDVAYVLRGCPMEVATGHSI